VKDAEQPPRERAHTRIPVPAVPGSPWALQASDALSALAVDPTRGLAPAEVIARRARFGANLLKAARRRDAFAILIDQFRSIVILLLIAAALLSFMFDDLAEACAILIVVVINTAIGFATELHAVRSMEALRQLGRVDTTVRRGGRLERIPADDLVPGDIVLLEGGDTVTADMRLIEAAKLQVDESALTGESVPVGKLVRALPAATDVTERGNVLFKGTAVTRGSSAAVVFGTGLDTEIGRITQLVLEAKAEETPLERRLDALGRRLVWVTLGIAALVAIAGVAGGRDTVLAIQVAIALAVAAIPEGLPIVATIALARGMWRMAQRRALISRLAAVETLGATGVILSDKTGTLTENRMTLTRIELSGASVEVSGTGLATRGEFTVAGGAPEDGTARILDELLEVAALCNNAALRSDSADGAPHAVGDPTEIALLVAAAKRGIAREALLARLPERREEPFDPDLKLMATYHQIDGALRVAVKGAPEAVLDHCTSVRAAGGDAPLTQADREAWKSRSHALGELGLRTLALASHPVADVNAPPYRDLVLLGVVGLLDPPREGVREALERCRRAGIEVVMITGDHPATARNIAASLGLIPEDAEAGTVVDSRRLGDLDGLGEAEQRPLLAARVIARANPKQKLDLIALHQARGRIVAMTGDGVNDAPALKKADIGVAMGVRGTQVAKESAAMVLADDEFSTIVEAIAQGRAIYANIRKFVVYLMSCNVSEILIVAVATLAGAPLPLLPLQILFLNLVTDVFPALALGVGEGEADLMRRAPRPAREDILTREQWWLIAGHGLVMSASVLAAMAVAVRALGFQPAAAVTVSFLTLALAQLWHVLNMRDSARELLHNEITRNPWIWGALALCLLLIACAVHSPALGGLLQLHPPSAQGWAVIASMSLVPVAAAPLVRRLAQSAAGSPR
jgi:Ca2+-transporting ATPase